MRNPGIRLHRFVMMVMWGLVALSLISMATPVAGGNATVTISPESFHGDSITALQPTYLNIAISNDVKLGGMQIGLQFSSPDGATWGWIPQTGGYGTSRYVSVVPGSRMHPGYLVWEATGLIVDETYLPDTIFIAGKSDTGGVEPGPQEVMMRLYLMMGDQPLDEIRTICIDSIFVPPDGSWMFADALSGDTIASMFDVPVCFPVIKPSWCCPTFVSGSTSMILSHCETGTASAQIYITDGSGDPVDFDPPIVNGGGGSAWLTFGAYTILHYTPIPSDVGRVIAVSVPYACFGHGVCNSWDVAVTVTNNPPMPDAGASYNALTLNKHFVKNDILGSDDDDCDVITFSLVEGTGEIDPATGVYTLDTKEEDIGIHQIILAADDGIVAVQDTFTIQVRDMPDWPGNANCNGAIDVGDAVFIINYVFRGGPRPPILNWADANGDCAINIGDAVYLVNRIFRSGPEPVPGCVE